MVTFEESQLPAHIKIYFCDAKFSSGMSPLFKK